MGVTLAKHWQRKVSFPLRLIICQQVCECSVGPLVVGDILDRYALDRAFELYEPRAVIHFAGLAYVGDSFGDPLRYYRTNTEGTITILETMLANDTKEISFRAPAPPTAFLKFS